MIIEILKSSNLIIHSEYVLFQAILKWLETKHGEQFTEFGELLLPFIRFPYLKPIELAYAETMFSENQRLRKLCMKLIKEAYRFCVLSPLQALIDVSFAQSFFNPRNYTSLAMHKMTLQSLTEGTSTPKLVKTCVGPVPTKSIETYWNLFHILSKETLNLWLYPENSALIQDLLVKALIVISNEDGHIIQVEELENECSTEKKMSIKVFLKRTELKNNITVILKCHFK
uniref:BACK domain-containing protein n=1 Tax=Biomphalaria glabrata TaxID=6526 RepID=A0A2C9LZ72_BIOGL